MSCILGITLTGVFAIQALYQITFHPLTSVPGPKICAIARMPYFYDCSRGLDVFWIDGLHQKNGPIVRFGPRDISFASAKAWKSVNGFVKNKRENDKALEFFIPPVNGAHSILTANFEDHARVRRLFSPAFSESAILTQQQPLLKKDTNLFLSKLRELSKDGDPVEMTSMFNFVTFDIANELAFGQELRQLEIGKYLPWVATVFDQLRNLPIMSMIAYYPVLTGLLSVFEPKWIKKKRREHCAFSEGIVRKQVQEGSAHEFDLVRVVLNKFDPIMSILILNLNFRWRLVLKDMTIEEMNSNAEFFVIAGSETIATHLSGAIFYLLKNPQCLHRLTQEIRSSFSTLEAMTCETLAQQPYLNTVIKESMRIFPSVGVGSPRVVGPDPQTIMGYTFPPGTRVSTRHYATYHSAANFRDPECSSPERNREEAEYYANDVRDAHQPFSVGPRAFQEQTFAQHEARMLLAALVHAFDLELCPSSADWDKRLRCCALLDKGAIYCRLRDAAAR
ncbi:cytochrome P450 [Xylariaceae sp. FL0255]|nr:cytochrome P450 [Xylariaceae sp. FL0255]